MNQQCIVKRVALTALLPMMAMTIQSQRAVGAQFPFQGRLTAPNGMPLSGPVEMDIALYAQQTGESPLFEELHPDVELHDGIFTLRIGSLTTGGVPESVIASEMLWLGIAVDGAAEFSPRILIDAVPRSQLSRSAEGLVIPGTAQPALTVAADGKLEAVAGAIFEERVEAVDIRVQDSESPGSIALLPGADGPGLELASGDSNTRAHLYVEGTRGHLHLNDGNGRMVDILGNGTMELGPMTAPTIAMNGVSGLATAAEFQSTLGGYRFPDGSTQASAAPMFSAGSGLTLVDDVFSVNPLSIVASMIAPGAVTEPKIANNAITSSKIVPNAVGSSHLAPDSVGASEIVVNAVGASEIAPNAVGASEIAPNAVGQSEIQPGAVGPSELASNAVTPAKLASDSDSLERVSDGLLRRNDNSIGIGTNLSTSSKLAIKAPDNHLLLTTNGLSTGAAIVFNPFTDSNEGTFVIQKRADDGAWIKNYVVVRMDNGRMGLGEVLNPTHLLELPNISGVGGRGLANAWNVYSAQKYKENIETIKDALAVIQDIRGVRFTWKPEHGGTADIGFIAEEIADILPELVTFSEDGQAIGLDYSRITAIAIEGIKAQELKISQLEVQLADIRTMCLEMQKSMYTLRSGHQVVTEEGE
jgi:hypothetical protein